jgi:hypothetical protein
VINWFINFLRVIKYGFKVFFTIILSSVGIINTANEYEKNKQGNKIDKEVEKFHANTEVDIFYLKKYYKKINFWETEEQPGRYGRNIHKLSPEKREKFNETNRQSNPLKSQGDQYEKHIGKQLEKNDNLVIYNGFIRGVNDNGVDIIVITPKLKMVNLVQCKNWTNKILTIDDIKTIHFKLNNYHSDYDQITPEDINFYLDQPKPEIKIIKLLRESQRYNFRKTLYITKDVDFKIRKHLIIMKPNILKYENMKIVVKNIS